MHKHATKLFLVMMCVALVVSACGPAATPTSAPPTEAPPTTAPEATIPPEPPAPETKQIRVGLVTDVGGPDDRSFNATAIKGLEDAKAKLGVDGKYLQSRQQTDYEKNIQEFIQQGYDMIVTVGFLLGVETAKQAKANPDVKFTIVDYAYPDCFGDAVEGKDCGSATPLDNVLGLTFQTDQAAFQAGYLAAALSKTKKVGTFGGLNIPTVTIFMVGFEGGVKYWNQQKNDNVEVLGWSTAENDGVFTGTFTDPDKGKQAALALIDEGADIILPVAGLTGNGAFTAAKEEGVLAIGVDTDQCISIPDACPVLLTSVMKNMDVAVFEAIKQVKEGTFKGGVYTGTLENNGVGLAPYHEHEDLVTPELQAELDQIRADIIAGKIDIQALAKSE